MSPVWVAILISGAGFTLSLLAVAVSAGRRAAQIDALQEAVKVANNELLQHRDANTKDLSDARQVSSELHTDLREFLTLLREYSREQTIINLQVSKSMDAITTRLENVGDLVMQHKAILDLHTEILRRKGLVEG